MCNNRNRRQANKMLSDIRTNKRHNRIEKCIVVEGSNDKECYKHFFSLKDNEIKFPPFSNRQGYNNKKIVKILIGLLNIDNEVKNLPHLGIVDTDLDEILENKEEKNNLFYTDTHDLETMILGNQECIEYIRDNSTILNNLSDNLLNKSIDNTVIIGWFRIRYHKKYENNNNRNFHQHFPIDRYNEVLNNKIEFNNFIINRDLDLRTFFEELINKGLNNLRSDFNIHPEDNDNINNINNKISRHQEENQIENYKLHMCRGHDLTKMIAYILHKDQTKNKKIEKELRKNYQYEHFKKTKLYQSIKDWEKNNINKPPVNVGNRVTPEGIERIELTENRTPAKVKKKLKNIHILPNMELSPNNIISNQNTNSFKKTTKIKSKSKQALKLKSLEIILNGS